MPFWVFTLGFYACILGALATLTWHDFIDRRWRKTSKITFWFISELAIFLVALLCAAGYATAQFLREDHAEVGNVFVVVIANCYGVWKLCRIYYIRLAHRKLVEGPLRAADDTLRNVLPLREPLSEGDHNYFTVDLTAWEWPCTCFPCMAFSRGRGAEAVGTSDVESPDPGTEKNVESPDPGTEKNVEKASNVALIRFKDEKRFDLLSSVLFDDNFPGENASRVSWFPWKGYIDVDPDSDESLAVRIGLYLRLALRHGKADVFSIVHSTSRHIMHTKYGLSLGEILQRLIEQGSLAETPAHARASDLTHLGSEVENSRCPVYKHLLAEGRLASMAESQDERSRWAKFGVELFWITVEQSEAELSTVLSQFPKSWTRSIVKSPKLLLFEIAVLLILGGDIKLGSGGDVPSKGDGKRSREPFNEISEIHIQRVLERLGHSVSPTERDKEDVAVFLKAYSKMEPEDLDPKHLTQTMTDAEDQLTMQGSGTPEQLGQDEKSQEDGWVGLVKGGREQLAWACAGAVHSFWVHAEWRRERKPKDTNDGRSKTSPESHRKDPKSSNAKDERLEAPSDDFWKCKESDLKTHQELFLKFFNSFDKKLWRLYREVGYEPKFTWRDKMQELPRAWHLLMPICELFVTANHSASVIQALFESDDRPSKTAPSRQHSASNGKAVENVSSQSTQFSCDIAEAMRSRGLKYNGRSTLRNAEIVWGLASLMSLLRAETNDTVMMLPENQNKHSKCASASANQEKPLQPTCETEHQCRCGLLGLSTDFLARDYIQIPQFKLSIEEDSYRNGQPRIVTPEHGAVSDFGEGFRMAPHMSYAAEGCGIHDAPQSVVYCSHSSRYKGMFEDAQKLYEEQARSSSSAESSSMLWLFPSWNAQRPCPNPSHVLAGHADFAVCLSAAVIRALTELEKLDKVVCFTMRSNTLANPTYFRNWTRYKFDYQGTEIYSPEKEDMDGSSTGRALLAR